MPRRVLVLTVFVVLIPALFRAQTPAAGEQTLVTVQGTVIGPDEQPLSGARVAIRKPGFDDDVLADTITDVDGKFALLAISLTPGRYIIHASGIGFGIDEQPFTVKADQPVNLTLSLKLKPQGGVRGVSTPYTVVRVFYATDRQSVLDHGAVHYIGIRSRDNSMSFGACDVSIPETHTLAEIERPSIWKLEFHADPEKHMVLQKVTPENKNVFFTQISSAVSASPGKEAFVFVHGYNVSFEDAAIRTAQLTYDFGFKGAPIFYDWPSKGSLLGYVADESAADETIPNLKRFLEDVANRSGASVVHVIAHSIGNRALLPTLAQLAEDKQFPNFAKFSTVVFAAPDVDRDAFIKWIGEIRKPQTKITLYVSQHDQALAASHLLFHKELRAGEGGTDSIVLSGMDTVDVSQLSTDALGHSYFGDNTNVVHDVLEFLKGQLAPRPGLSKIPLGTLAYWELLATTKAASN
jgi:esterase/lipase superfamily enzyme